jgi:tetratricopeptide (TPR) repeat protein
MNRLILLACAAPLFPSMPAQSAPAPVPTKSWVNEDVMPRKPHEQIKFGDRAKGEIKEVSFYKAWTMRVREDKDGRIRIYNGISEAWVDKEEFVPLQSASAFFGEQLKQKPQDPGLLMALAAACLETNELDKAIDACNKLLEVNANEPNGFMLRCFARSRKKEYKKALEDADEFIRLMPDSPFGFNNRGGVWLKLKNYDKARQDYDEALRLDPLNPRYLSNRATIEILKSDNDKAIKELGEALRLDPENATILLNLGSAWFDKFDYDKAIDYFTRAIRINRKLVDAFNARGRAWGFKKEYRKALDDFEEAILLAPKDPVGFLNKGQLLASCADDKYRNLEKAKEQLKAVAALHHHDAFVDELAGLIAAAEGRFDEAIQLQKKALEDKDYNQLQGLKARWRWMSYQQKKPWRE